ncbi:hypothetical protein CCAX7_16570 [Capsulimonas corticalis]|uniref:Uncharacterized protein n=1 Tax=Capsulimonas corticalis TaxID=2219043 RepID=A0A402CZ04_9BACT|nr:hypothetical protein [Capsulimonas corticalis]BDI29606.1 hypothetical protein CCAX7_16570 [Capsulimonas corticalis]
MKPLFQPLLHLFSPLAPLERALLGALDEALPGEAGSIFRDQVRAINHVQRSPGYREIRLYTRAHGKTTRNAGPCFPLQDDDYHLATIRFTIPGRSGSWKARFDCVKGSLFAIDVTPSPQDICRHGAIHVSKVDIANDPMMSRTAR